MPKPFHVLWAPGVQEGCQALGHAPEQVLQRAKNTAEGMAQGRARPERS